MDAISPYTVKENTHNERVYLDMLTRLMRRGQPRPDRTGTGTLSLFGEQMRFDLTKSYPLLTTKRMSFRNIFWELVWFITGSTDIRFLQERGVKIWDPWQPAGGHYMGPIYGAQWRGTYGDTSVDQLAGVLTSLDKDPYGRRHIVSAWNPADLDAMALPPCHMMFQFYVRDGGLGPGKRYLDCHLYQRSADMFVGVPYNIASYALLVHILCLYVQGLVPGTLVCSYGDLHLYQNHVEAANKQLTRALSEKKVSLDISPLHDFVQSKAGTMYAPAKFLDLLGECPKEAMPVVREYDPLPAIPVPVAV